MKKMGATNRRNCILAAMIITAVFAVPLQAAAGKAQAKPAAPSAGKNQPKVTVQEFAEVTGGTILVGDIADITGVSSAEKSRIANLKIGNAPSPNEEITFNSSQIKGRIHNSGVDLDKFEFSAPAKTVVRRKASIVTGKQLVEEGIEFLKSNVPGDVKTLEIEAKTYPSDIVLPYGEVKLDFVMDTRPQRFGTQSFRVKILLNGDVKRVVTVSSYLRVMTDVMCADKDLGAFHVMLEEDVKTCKVELSGLKPGALTDLQQIVGRQLSRGIGRGDVITHSAVSQAPDVKSGDIVKIVLRGNGFEVASKGKALEKGFIGETIRVLNQGSRKVLDAIVVDSQTVEVMGPRTEERK